MAINERIKKLRKKHNLTQAELGEKVNVSMQVISNWERNYTNPTHDDVARLAKILRCSADYLLSGVPDPKIDLTEAEQCFIDSLDLSDEEIILKTPINFEGRKLTNSEKRKVISVVRALLKED